MIFPKIRGSWFAVNVNESKIIGKLCSSQSLAEMFHNQTCKVHSFKTCYFPSVWRFWRFFCLSQMKETYKLMEHKNIFWSLTTCIFTSKEESCIKPQNNFQWTKLANPIFFSFFYIRCFERFFRGVNVKEGKLVAKRRAYLMEDLDLIGVDYLWQVITHCSCWNYIFSS